MSEILAALVGLAGGMVGGLLEVIRGPGPVLAPREVMGEHRVVLR